MNGGISIEIGCLWRVLDWGRIIRTSEDHGHKFGLPQPVDSAEEVNKRFAGTSITATELHRGTLDLHISFDNGQITQIIPNSAGYEAWQVLDGSREFIAVGGGDLAIVGAGS